VFAEILNDEPQDGDGSTLLKLFRSIVGGHDDGCESGLDERCVLDLARDWLQHFKG